jgi:heme exporter protein D
MDLGPHAFFVVAAYAATSVVLAGLILHAVIAHGAQVRALAELEARGVTRRSQDTMPTTLSREPSALQAPGGG